MILRVGFPIMDVVRVYTTPPAAPTALKFVAMCVNHCDQTSFWRVSFVYITCVGSCFRGIITYAMVVGALPFRTPYRDEYQRQLMLQQIQKGLSPFNEREMQPLTAGA